MRALAMSRQSSVATRADADRPPARRRKANGGDGGRERECNDTRTIFQLRCKSLRHVPLHDVAIAYKSCRSLSGVQRDAYYIASDLDGHRVEAYFPTIERLEKALGPPPSIARRHLDSARDALFHLLPPSDSPLPDHEDPDDTA
jgi:hypothetical protein